MMNKSARKLAVLAIASVSVALTAPVQAQIEEIVVTARKKEENLQEIPLVITTISAEAIQRKGCLLYTSDAADE